MKCTVITLALLIASVDAGTNKTEAPTELVLRPTKSPSNPPLTPFPTEGPDLTEEPTPSPVS